MRYLYILLSALMLVSCSSNDEPQPYVDNGEVEKTVIMFFPWSGNLKSYFLQNINDFSKAITNYASTNRRVIVCIESSKDEADIIRLKYYNGTCRRDTLEHYSNPEFTTVSGLTKMLNKVTKYSPSKSYSMVVGCHGNGWLPVTRNSQAAPSRYSDDENSLTRFFGHASDSDYQIEVKDFAQAISDAGMKMQFILFDACYMSTIEVAYTLRNVTDYLIACPTEIMNPGFPYSTCGKYLLQESDYGALCDAFYDFYISYEYPYGTIAVTECNQLDALATTVRNINLSDQIADLSLSDIQVMDGNTPTIYFDLADALDHKCTDATLLSDFHAQLDKAIPYKRHTPRFYSGYLSGSDKTLPISTYCGTTTSDISINSKAQKIADTEWYQATH